MGTKLPCRHPHKSIQRESFVNRMHICKNRMAHARIAQRVSNPD